MSNLEIFGSYRGTDEDSLNKIIELFETKTGHSVNYVGSANFAGEIIDFALEESLPDIAIVPQPGLLLDLAALGFIQPLKKNTQIWVSENYASGDSWNDLVSLETNGETTLYGYFFDTGTIWGISIYNYFQKPYGFIVFSFHASPSFSHILIFKSKLSFCFP